MRLFNVAVQCFKVEIELPQILGQEFSDFELKDHQRGRSTVIEQQVDIKILVAHLQPVFFADEQKIFAQFENEDLHVLDEAFLQGAFAVGFGQAEEFQHIVIFKGSTDIGCNSLNGVVSFCGPMRLRSNCAASI